MNTEEYSVMLTGKIDNHEALVTVDHPEDCEDEYGEVGRFISVKLVGRNRNREVLHLLSNAQIEELEKGIMEQIKEQREQDLYDIAENILEEREARGYA